MTINANEYAGPFLSDEDIRFWKAIPTTVISDALGRVGGMTGAIKPIAPNMGFVGQALTVNPMGRSNTALHYALDHAWRGCVMVVNARGNMANAVWGGVSTQAAKSRGVAAMVIDGCARDLDMLLASGVPVYARGVAPNGPDRSVGGEINVPISCGGVDVMPGDLIVGDSDGVVVASLSVLPVLAGKCKERADERAEYLRRIGLGPSTHQVWDLPDAKAAPAS